MQNGQLVSSCEYMVAAMALYRYFEFVPRDAVRIKGDEGVYCFADDDLSTLPSYICICLTTPT